MIREVIISPLNHIRFVPVGSTQSARYNTQHPDQDWFANLILSWQTKVEYMQKVQNSDRFDLQILATVNKDQTETEGFSTAVDLFNCKGEYIKRISSPQVTASFKFEEDGLKWVVQSISGSTFWEGVPEGQYYLYMEVPFDTDNDTVPNLYKAFISEPIDLKAKHPKTILIEYSNSFNKDNVIFEQVPKKFALRVEGALLDVQHKVRRTVFIDQGENPKLLSATAYKTCKLIVGGDQVLIPDYLIEKLNHAFALDSVYVEGREFVGVEGAAFEKETLDDYPLFSANIEIQEAETGAGNRFRDGGLTIFSEIPEYPFVIAEMKIGFVGNYDYAVPAPTRIPSIGALDSWIMSRNAEIGNAGLSGTIVRNGQNVEYVLGQEETYDDLFKIVFEKRTAMYNNAAAGATIALTLKISTLSSNGKFAVTNPQGSVIRYDSLNSGIISIMPISGTVTHTSAMHLFEFWHMDNFHTLSITGNRIVNVFNDVPSTLTEFELVGCQILGEFDFQMLQLARNSLHTAKINFNPGLELIGNFWMMAGPIKLKNIDISRNAISSSLVDNFFIGMQTAFMAGQLTITNGTITTKNQNPLAPPSGSSLSARNTLTSMLNWTVITD